MALIGRLFAILFGFLAACLVVREQDYPTGKSRYVLDCFAAIAMTESPE